MRKLSFYPKLAARSIKNNRQFYLPYILTVIGTCAAMYILYALNFDPGFSRLGEGTSNGQAYVSMFMTIGIFLVSVFCFIFLVYTNSFLMTRASNFFFDIMVVAGIAAIRLSILKDYWGIILIMGVVGLVITYVYNYFVAKTLLPEYTEEQFLTMYGMLTGTASTGVILLREIDGEFKTPALDNLVYQNFPAIVFGFPMMLLATLAPVKPVLTLIILIIFFAAMNVILFRSKIFKRRKKA